MTETPMRVGADQASVELALSDRIDRAVRADVANLRATPTARVLLAGSVVMACASGVANLSAVADGDLGSPDTVELAMHASTVATLVFAMVAGLVSATADFRFGRIDQSLLSDSSRPIFVAGKTLMATLVGFVYGIVGAMTAVAATTGFFAVKGESFDPLVSAVVRPLVGLLLGAGLFAACGAAIGTAVRHQAAALTGALTWLLIVEPTALIGTAGNRTLAAGRGRPGTDGKS